MGELFLPIDKRMKEFEDEVMKLKNNVKTLVKQYNKINVFSEEIKNVFRNK